VKVHGSAAVIFPKWTSPGGYTGKNRDFGKGNYRGILSKSESNFGDFGSKIGVF
jgi:hypothetical protein